VHSLIIVIATVQSSALQIHDRDFSILVQQQDFIHLLQTQHDAVVKTHRAAHKAGSQPMDFLQL
jgi:hypothetical protein